jgi:hypothetical protein
VSDDLYTAPAGWYPDPLGLPQLRWWNNHSWTEQVSAARQPIVVQDSRFAWANDDSVPRTEPAFERATSTAPRQPTVVSDMRFAWADDDAPQPQENVSGVRGGDPASPVVTAEALRELEPPRAGLKVEVDDAPAEGPAPLYSPPTYARTTPSFATASPFDWAMQPGEEHPPAFSPAPTASAPEAPKLSRREALRAEREAAAAAAGASTPHDTTLPGEPATAFTTTVPDAPEPVERGPVEHGPVEHDRVERETVERPNPGRAASVVATTGPVWVLALIPLIQLVLALAFLTALDLGNSALPFLGVIVAGYVVSIPLAYADRARLRAGGNERTAHWALAFLTPMVYLVVRMRYTLQQSGQGIAPFLVWAALGMLQVASIVAIPGLLIASLPAVFTDQVETSIERDAVSMLNTVLTVDCDSAPALPRQEVVCLATGDDGETHPVTATFARENGWVAFPVNDWGSWAERASVSE